MSTTCKWGSASLWHLGSGRGLQSGKLLFPTLFAASNNLLLSYTSRELPFLLIWLVDLSLVLPNVQIWQWEFEVQQNTYACVLGPGEYVCRAVQWITGGVSLKAWVPRDPINVATAQNKRKETSCSRAGESSPDTWTWAQMFWEFEMFLPALSRVQSQPAGSYINKHRQTVTLSSY